MNNPSATQPQLTTDSLISVLDAYRQEYRDLLDSWRHLDGKAQGAVVTAGVFLAAAFAFVTRITADKLSTTLWLSLLIGTVLLLASDVVSLFALRIRQFIAAPLGDALDQLTGNLLRVPDHDDRMAREPDFLRDQIHMWKQVNAKLQRIVVRKGRLVLAAQALIIASIAVFGTLTVALVWRLR